MSEERMYPFIDIQVIPEGVALRVMLAPGMAFLQTLSEQVMNDLVKKWKEVQKEKQTMLSVVRNNPIVLERKLK